jgi:hypothetical protein
MIYEVVHGLTFFPLSFQPIPDLENKLLLAEFSEIQTLQSSVVSLFVISIHHYFFVNVFVFVCLNCRAIEYARNI